MRKSTCSSVIPSGTLTRLVPAYGTLACSACRPSMRCPKIHPMPPTLWQCAGMPEVQKEQIPQLVTAGMITLSPTARPVTSAPSSVTVPTASWPRMRPSVTAGTSPLRMCRSVPQMVVVSIRTIASVGSRICGSGTSSQAF